MVADQLGFHLSAHGFEVGIVSDVETCQQVTGLLCVVQHAVAEDTLGISQLLGDVLDMLVEPTPCVHHGFLLDSHHALFHLLLKAGQLIAGELHPEVAGRHGENAHVQGELVGHTLLGGVVLLVVEITEPTLGTVHEVVVVVDEHGHEGLPLRLLLTKVLHERQVVGTGQDAGAVDAPRQGVLGKLLTDQAGLLVNVGQQIVERKQRLVVPASTGAGTVIVCHFLGRSLVELTCRPLRDRQGHEKGTVIKHHRHVSYSAKLLIYLPSKRCLVWNTR